MSPLYTNNPARNAGTLTTHDPTIAQSSGGGLVMSSTLLMMGVGMPR